MHIWQSPATVHSRVFTWPPGALCDAIRFIPAVSTPFRESFLKLTIGGRGFRCQIERLAFSSALFPEHIIPART